MRIVSICLGLVFTVMLAVPPVFSAQDSASISRDSTRHKMWTQLGLSEDQKAKLKDMRKDMREFRKQNFEKMKVLLDKSKDELLKQSPSKTALYGYAKEIGDLHREMSQKMADHMLKIKSVLSKDQFVKLLSNEFMPPMGGPRRGLEHDGPHQGPPPIPTIDLGVSSAIRHAGKASRHASFLWFSGLARSFCFGSRMCLAVYFEQMFF